MAQYTITQAADRLAAAGGGLGNRVQMGLLKYAAGRYGAADATEKAYIRRLATNPAGEANSALPVLLAVLNVATATADPTDAEITTGIGTVWAFLCGS